MKTREDFVSNSSSCSFMVAINGTYDIESFAKDLAKSCCNPKSEFHCAGLEKHNRKILDFCLSTYELAFLGCLELETKEHKWTLADFKRIYKNDEDAQQQMDAHIENIKRCKDADCDPTFREDFKHDFYDKKTETLHTFEKVCAQGLAVDSDTMRYAFDHYGYKTDDEPATKKLRVKNLIKYAKAHSSHSDGMFDRNIDIYRVTERTLKNTRELIEAGHSISLPSWCKDLDEAEKRLKDGEQIFGLRIAHQGDGWGNYYIYMDDEADGLDNLAVEILDSECL